jgi:hypothetical protein
MIFPLASNTFNLVNIRMCQGRSANAHVLSSPLEKPVSVGYVDVSGGRVSRFLSRGSYCGLTPRLGPDIRKKSQK